MERWSAEENQWVASLWSNVDVPEVGGEILERMMVVHPWTQRFFDHFRNLSNPSANWELKLEPDNFTLLGRVLIVILTRQMRVYVGDQSLAHRYH